VSRPDTRSNPSSWRPFFCKYCTSYINNNNNYVFVFSCNTRPAALTTLLLCSDIAGRDEHLTSSSQKWPPLWTWPVQLECKKNLSYCGCTEWIVWTVDHYITNDREFPITSARLWNSLPSHITAAPPLSSFHSRLKSHLFSLSYPSLWFSLLLLSAHAATFSFWTL